MCGFVGLFGSPFAERRATLDRMLPGVAHRGPDGGGVFEEGPLALAHRRLALLDVSDAAAQPMVHPQSGHVLAFNGTLYNYLELRDELAEPSRSSGDTEVLLRLLAERDDSVLARLNGTWAFALWAPATRTLTLSRDRFGVKPLYWRMWNGRLAFASEIAALLALDPGGRRAAPERLASFLVDRRIDHSTGTLFADIQQVAPGTSLRFHADRPTQPRVDRHWSPPGMAEARHDGDPQALLALLDDAVRLRLRADVPIGFLLSGGLDSSAVVASAAGQRPLHAYTLRYDDPDDESRFAAAVAEHCPGVTLSYVEPAEETLEEALRRLVRVQGEPFADGSMLAHYRLMERIAADGHKVVLGGQGGDEALAGYVPTFAKARAADLLLAGRLTAAARALGGTPRALLGAAVHTLPRAPRNHLHRRWAAHRYGDWLGSAWVARCAPRYGAEPGGRLEGYLNAARSSWALPGFLHYEDRNAMVHGLEARAPLLDYRLVEWGLGCPPERLIADGVGKMVLREALSERLPPTVSRRPLKQSLPAPAGRWMRENPELIHQALRIAATRFGMERSDVAARAYDTARRGGGPLPPGKSDLLWRLLTAALWADEFDVSC
ncbi:asparagine synthase (glutamine-hydrolyzing) [Endothiovibrio diazotrophicus]